MADLVREPHPEYRSGAGLATEGLGIVTGERKSRNSYRCTTRQPSGLTGSRLHLYNIVPAKNHRSLRLADTRGRLRAGRYKRLRLRSERSAGNLKRGRD